MRVKRLQPDGTYGDWEKANPNVETEAEKIERLEKELQAAREESIMTQQAVTELMNIVLTQS